MISSPDETNTARICDEAYEVLKKLIPQPKQGGRPAEHSQGEIVDAIYEKHGTAEDAEGAEMMDHNDMTEKIIGCAIAVHRELGPGLLESTYEACLVDELCESGLSVERQQPLNLSALSALSAVILSHSSEAKTSFEMIQLMTRRLDG